MKFYCELKKVVDDSYDIEIGRSLENTLIDDIKNGLVGGNKQICCSYRFDSGRAVRQRDLR